MGEWATQYLGLNITRAYARRLSGLFGKVSTPSAVPSPGFGDVFFFVYPLKYVASPREGSTPRSLTPHNPFDFAALATFTEHTSTPLVLLLS
jgi:hypothetical protein